MSPLDDELRAALQGRATVLTPSPDPLAGIERRARRMRRNRAATAVAGSVLAVAAIALVVPALSPGASTAPAPPATSPTAVVTTPSPTPSSECCGIVGVFSFDEPWAYRDDGSTELADGTAETFRREWATREGAPVDEVDLVVLYGERHEPSGTDRFLYAARVRNTEKAEYGLVRAVDGGLFGPARPLLPDTAALVLPVPGDETTAVLVVAEPGSQLSYATAGVDFQPMTEKADGVGIAAVEGDGGRDAVQVAGPGGDLRFTGPVPDYSDGEPDLAQGPDNLLGWPFRGAHDEALEQRAAAAYAASQGVDDVETRVLSTGGTDGGLVWTLLEGWVPGERAQVFGWVERPDGSTEPVLQPLNDPDEQVVALLLTGVPGRSTDELVVVPSPLTGQVLYTDDAGTQRPVEPAPGYDSVVLVDRERDAQADSLVVLDGDGDLERPLYDGSVFTLLCGEKGCG